MDYDFGDRVIALENFFPKALGAGTRVVVLVIVEPILDRPHAAIIDVGDEFALCKIRDRFGTCFQRVVEAFLETLILLSPPIYSVAGKISFFARQRYVGDHANLF